MSNVQTAVSGVARKYQSVRRLLLRAPELLNHARRHLDPPSSSLSARQVRELKELADRSDKAINRAATATRRRDTDNDRLLALYDVVDELNHDVDAVILGNIISRASMSSSKLSGAAAGSHEWPSFEAYEFEDLTRDEVRTLARTNWVLNNARDLLRSHSDEMTVRSRRILTKKADTIDVLLDEFKRSAEDPKVTLEQVLAKLRTLMDLSDSATVEWVENEDYAYLIRKAFTEPPYYPPTSTAPNENEERVFSKWRSSWR
jgi:hypothetical protein